MHHDFNFPVSFSTNLANFKFEIVVQYQPVLRKLAEATRTMVLTSASLKQLLNLDKVRLSLSTLLFSTTHEVCSVTF